MRQGHGEVNGISVPKNYVDEKLASTVDLYIGIFFDGTNNNKYQVMLGKMFRRKEIFENAKKRLKEKLNNYLFIRDFNPYNDKQSSSKVYDIFNLPNLSDRESWEPNGNNKGVFSEGELNFIYGRNGKVVRSVNDVLKLSRGEVETYYPGVFTRSELEFFYYGYGNINDTTDISFDTFIEKKSYVSLGGKDPNHLSAKPDGSTVRRTLQRASGNLALLQDATNTNKDDAKRLESYKGAPAQNSTYTNIAILESLYKCENKTNIDGETFEKHISIYIEGSGSDMQFEASSNWRHSLGHGVIGLGKGTGPSGAMAKVRKAVIMIEQIMERHRPMNGEQRTINLHFDVCGFSRGAACARMFCYVLSPNKEGKTYDGEGSIISNKKDLKLFTGKKTIFLKNYTTSNNYKLENKVIRNLLIADTVASIGVLYNEGIGGFVKNKATRSIVNTLGVIGKGLEVHNNIGVRKVDEGTENIDMWGKRPYHYQNVNDYGLWATKLAKNVIHICAMDEVRQNFALTDIQSSIDEGNGIEIFIPGCHTDIGGGAAIGMEEAKIPNTGLIRYLSSYHVHSRSELQNCGSESRVRRLNVDTLKEIGWLNYDSKSTENKDKTITGRSKLKEDETYYSENSDKVVPNIILYRHVTPGYSNVSLNCFKEKAKGEPFKDIPLSYAVPDDLNSLFHSIISLTASDRYFVYPSTPKQYYELRRKYLHFSYNEQLKAPADNLLVNGPEFTEITVVGQKIKVNSRIIYSGFYQRNDEFGKTRKHMFDYNSSQVKMFGFPTKKFVSKEGLNLIKRFEGCKLVAYQDSVGVWTIGYGHTEGVKEGMTITQSEADEMLAKEVESYATEVDKMVNKELTQNQRDALTSFAYNVGTEALRNSTLLKRINEENSSEDTIRNEFCRWTKAGGKELNGLKKRRNEEAALFFKQSS